MPLFSESYRQMNAELHTNEPAFGTHGHQMAEAIAQLYKRSGARSVLDFGCGKGTFKPAFLKLVPGAMVAEYDFAIPGKDTPPSPADIVCCLDVMEHIEPECLDEVIAYLRSLTGKFLVATVALLPAKKILADGRNAHLIVKDQAWWMDQFGRHFRKGQATDKNEDSFYAVFVP
jgi:2-polyprenyl-3-methyl-5-hydroxy-6-metoxy-1,4-benzoquinol methylase